MTSDDDPFGSGPWTEDERAFYQSWPEVAQDLMDRTAVGVADLITAAYQMPPEVESKLRHLMQNLLMGRFSRVEILPEVICSGCALPESTARKIASDYAQTVLIAFNATLKCWKQDIRTLYDSWR